MRGTPRAWDAAEGNKCCHAGPQRLLLTCVRDLREPLGGKRTLGEMALRILTQGVLNTPVRGFYHQDKAR